jgi:nifR3 family TIM-barrel protein
MARAAALAVGAGAHVVDINMGCPVKKVTRTGAGAALMCDVPRAVEVVRAVRAAVGPGVPVTAKIRSGWDQDSVNCVEVGRALEGAGVAALAIHARTRAQGYAGRADWRWIAALKRAVSVPVVGNGDVRSVADAQRMVAETGCDMVMVGRGALGNPWVFRSLVAGHQAPPTAAERLAVVSRHLADHVVHVGEPARAVREFRPHLGWYSRGLVGGAAFRAAVMVTGGLDAVEALCREFFGSAREGGGEPEPEVWDEEGSG